MKRINVVFEDKEYEKLAIAKIKKRSKSWHDFILSFVDKAGDK